MPKKHQTICALSALYAALLWCGLALLVSNKLAIWGRLGTSEKFWTVFASVYSFALAGSGALYWGFGRRFIGIIHAVLTLGIAGFVLFRLGGLSSPGSDNAAAGILAAANLVFVVGGALAAIFGIGVMACVFSKPKNVEEDR